MPLQDVTRWCPPSLVEERRRHGQHGGHFQRLLIHSWSSNACLPRSIIRGAPPAKLLRGPLVIEKSFYWLPNLGCHDQHRDSTYPIIKQNNCESRRARFYESGVKYWGATRSAKVSYFQSKLVHQILFRKQIQRLQFYSALIYSDPDQPFQHFSILHNNYLLLRLVPINIAEIV